MFENLNAVRRSASKPGSGRPRSPGRVAARACTSRSQREQANLRRSCRITEARRDVFQLFGNGFALVRQLAATVRTLRRLAAIPAQRAEDTRAAACVGPSCAAPLPLVPGQRRRRFRLAGGEMTLTGDPILHAPRRCMQIGGWHRRAIPPPPERRCSYVRDQDYRTTR